MIGGDLDRSDVIKTGTAQQNENSQPQTSNQSHMLTRQLTRLQLAHSLGGPGRIDPVKLEVVVGTLTVLLAPLHLLPPQLGRPIPMQALLALALALVLIVVFEQLLLLSGPARVCAHHLCVVLGLVLDLLEVGVVLAVCEPVEHVDAFLPVQLERVCRLVVLDLLGRDVVGVHALLDPKFLDEHVKGLVEDANDGALPDDGPVPCGEVRDKHAQE